MHDEQERMANHFQRLREEGWLSMDRTVSDAFRATGPDGYMEFGEGMWRMHYADGSIWRPEEP